MKRLALLLVFLLLLASQAWGAGSSVTFSGEDLRHDRPGGGRVYVITATVLSDDADGSATGTTTSIFHGLLMSAQSDPGSTAPTAAWDYTAADHSGGADLLNGGGADRSATVTEWVKSAGGDNILAVPINGPLTLTFSNMGNAKTAVIRAVIWE